MVGAVANRFSDVLPLAGTRSVCVGGIRGVVASLPYQRHRSEYIEETVYEEYEEQGRESQIDERNPQRDKSVETVRLGEKFRGASVEDPCEGTSSIEANSISARLHFVHHELHSVYGK